MKLTQVGEAKQPEMKLTTKRRGKQEQAMTQTTNKEVGVFL
jgi:hypothetical protein